MNSVQCGAMLESEWLQATKDVFFSASILRFCFVFCCVLIIVRCTIEQQNAIHSASNELQNVTISQYFYGNWRQSFVIASVANATLAKRVQYEIPMCSYVSPYTCTHIDQFANCNRLNSRTDDGNITSNCHLSHNTFILLGFFFPPPLYVRFALVYHMHLREQR